jgi:hypothetical protein
MSPSKADSGAAASPELLFNHEDTKVCAFVSSCLCGYRDLRQRGNSQRCDGSVELERENGDGS